MAKRDKLKEKLFSRPKDFTWKELTTVLKNEGFELIPNNGGSSRKFFNKEKDVLINLHEPHPNKIIKTYLINQIIIKLEECADE